MVYFLATNPTALARLREEVLEKVGPSEKPTYDDIRDIRYLRAVINGGLLSSTIKYHAQLSGDLETLRLFPAV